MNDLQSMKWISSRNICVSSIYFEKDSTQESIVINVRYLHNFNWGSGTDDNYDGQTNLLNSLETASSSVEQSEMHHRQKELKLLTLKLLRGSVVEEAMIRETAKPYPNENAIFTALKLCYKIHS